MMTAPFLVGSVVTAKFVQVLIITTLASKMRNKNKKKEVDQSWSLIQFLEESRLKK